MTQPYAPAPILSALEAAHGHPEIKRFWLDCEFTNAGDYSPDSNVSAIKQALALVRVVRPDLEVGIYTGGWWWQPHTNNYAGADLCDLPLWFGNYRDPDGVDYKSLLFGGWKDAAMWQYQDVYTAGLNTDRSLILEDDMADTYTRAEIDAKVGALLGLGVAQGGQISAIATALFDHIKNHNSTSVADTEAKVQELLDQLAQEQADLHDRIEKAGDILKGAPSA